MHWNSEELVIDEAIKHGEKAHQQKKIPHKKRAFHGASSQFAFKKTKNRSDEEKEEPMAHIAKHDSEEERERHDGEDSRVNLLVHWDTIGVHDLLENS